MSNAVLLKCESYIQSEDVATTAISPGMLVDLTPTGGVKYHGTADVSAVSRFAIEADVWGKTIDDAYAIGDTVVYAAVPSGSQVQAIIADGQTITRGDFLCSAGNGTLKAITGTEVKLAQAEISKTASGSSEFITVTIL